MAKIKASKILKKAKSQIGTTNTGKFNKAYYGRNINYAWCGVFVWWVFKKCKALHLLNGMTNYAYVPTWHNWAKENKLFHKGLSGIKTGDLLLFEFDGDSGADHIGIFEKFVGTGVSSIDGNTSSSSENNGGCVNRRIRPKSFIKGYIKLAYDEGDKYKGLFPKHTVNVKVGSKTNIKRWQKFLCWYGVDVAVDGSFGPDTKAKTKTFQRNQHLTADGSAGPKTIARAKAYKR